MNNHKPTRMDHILAGMQIGGKEGLEYIEKVLDQQPEQAPQNPTPRQRNENLWNSIFAATIVRLHFDAAANMDNECRTFAEPDYIQLAQVLADRYVVAAESLDKMNHQMNENGANE